MWEDAYACSAKEVAWQASKDSIGVPTRILPILEEVGKGLGYEYLRLDGQTPKNDVLYVIDSITTRS